jgi:hypothetical protein
MRRRDWPEVRSVSGGKMGLPVYYIRKLNQAYLANGQYADRPGFVSPLGIGLRELRAKSSSLKDFLDVAASMTSHQDLDQILERLASN